MNSHSDLVVTMALSHNIFSLQDISATSGSHTATLTGGFALQHEFPISFIVTMHQKHKSTITPKQTATTYTSPCNYLYTS